jgi:transcriptional regulator with XRE-family HTH domain
LKKAGFDAQRFYQDLDETRLERGVQWRQVARESGISASTLTRMAQGKRPDVDGLAALVRWSGLEADKYMVGEQRQTEPVARIASYLRADPNLDPGDAEALTEMIRGAYSLATRKSKA